METPSATEKSGEKLAASAKKIEHSTERVEDSADRRTQSCRRTVFAAERTYGAWMRTGLVALASGIAAQKLLEGLMPAWIIGATRKRSRGIFCVLLCSRRLAGP